MNTTPNPAGIQSGAPEFHRSGRPPAPAAAGGSR